MKEGYAEVMYIPPSEFNPYEWKANYTPTLISGFELLLAMIGVVAAMCLVRLRGRV